ncbi:hypothetical protein ACFQZJ_07625 [Maribacter chungangensis]|uniref:Uncharacterized protein n=1 Tax=Maribacter chungangensis TaxID=1069117 RepID=A0ABW3B406_9FLAO
MNRNIFNKRERLFSSRVFIDLGGVAKALNSIGTKNISDTEVTLLLKLEEDDPNTNREIEKIKKRLTNIWGSKLAFGFFHNIDIGSIFIAGPLSEVFLFEIDGKKLAELSEGPYGILRGLGIGETVAASHIKALMHGDYLLLKRQGYHNIHENKYPQIL